jgi:hypothetical protein
MRLKASWPKICVSITLSVACACGSTPDPDPPDSGTEPTTVCPTNSSPTFELGTGAERFEPLTDGQTLKMATGPQGGCHFWLAVRTNGFAERLFDIQYELFYADTGMSTDSKSSSKVRLRESGMTGVCEYYGYTAFIVRPADVVGKRIRIDVKVTDDLMKTAMMSKTVVAALPDVMPELCMVR